MFVRFIVSVSVCVIFLEAVKCNLNCRDSRSSQLRLDGGLCFEIPPWQHQPVEVEKHLNRIRNAWGNSFLERRHTRLPKFSLHNREVNRYVDTVIAPFLDTYHRNIQNSYQQLTNKILKKIKDEINVALRKKHKIYTELTELADSLKVPAMCDEERRASRTLASKHVAQIYMCTENARTSIAEMGKYAEEMISITRNHMEFALTKVAKNLENDEKARHTKIVNVTSYLKELSKAAVALGYELDLSLTNARRHNEQSCEKLTSCCNKARRSTDEAASTLRQPTCVTYDTLRLPPARKATAKSRQETPQLYFSLKRKRLQ